MAIHAWPWCFGIPLTYRAQRWSLSQAVSRSPDGASFAPSGDGFPYGLHEYSRFSKRSLSDLGALSQGNSIAVGCKSSIETAIVRPFLRAQLRTLFLTARKSRASALCRFTSSGLREIHAHRSQATSSVGMALIFAPSCSEARCRSYRFCRLSQRSGPLPHSFPRRKTIIGVTGCFSSSRS